MPVADVVVLVAAVVACTAALVCLGAAVVLVGTVRRFERGVESLRAEAVPLVSGARQAVEEATTEMARVGSVLEGTESVTATVEGATRLAKWAFANPVVKVLALRAGAASGLRQLAHPEPAPPADHPSWPAKRRRRSRRTRHPAVVEVSPPPLGSVPARPRRVS